MGDLQLAQEPLTAQTEAEADVVLSVEGVSKKFCRDLKRSLLYGVQDITSEMTGSRRSQSTLRKHEFWALQDISLQLRRGESLGLIGKNGSGKSTLLRIIAGLIKPDAGITRVHGRVAPLIALGAGFSPILTGRENIYTNMSILGLSRREIDERFDEVVAFAEIEAAIDAPVQTYSSGMAARLGFASAIHTNPDILLIDEVLSVGDAKFQSKCYLKLNQLRQSNTSFILVSHSAHSIATVCDRAFYLQQGKKVLSGAANAVLNQYEEDAFLGSSKVSLGAMSIPRAPKGKGSGLDVVSIFFRNKDQAIVTSPTTGEMTVLCIQSVVNKPQVEVSLSVKARKLSDSGSYLMYMNSWDDGLVYDSLAPGEYEMQLQMSGFGLGVGLYDFKIEIYTQKIALLQIVESFKFDVKSVQSQSCQSQFYQPHQWSLLKSPLLKSPFPRVLHNGTVAGIGGPLIKLHRMQQYFPNAPHNYNIIYGSWGSIPASVCQAAQARGVKVVFHINSVFHPAYGDNTTEENADSAAVYALADYVVYGSHQAKLGAQRYLGKTNAPSSIIYNGLDTQHFRPAPNPDPERFNILAAGVQYIRHRLVPLIQAMPHIQAVYPHAKLIIAGPLVAGQGIYDCSLESIQRVIKKAGLTNVTFLGEYSQLEAPEIYAQGDVLVHLKHMDWTPNTVAEAMACGLPIVHAGNGGMNELVKTAGVSLDLPVNWDHIHTPTPILLAEKIVQAYQQKDSLGQSARQLAKEQYDLLLWVEKHQQIFEQLLSP